MFIINHINAVGGGYPHGEWTKGEGRWYLPNSLHAADTMTDGRMIDRYTREQVEGREWDRKIALYR